MTIRNSGIASGLRRNVARYVLLGLAVAGPASLSAQATNENAHPLIERLTFEGLQNVERRDLEQTLKTQATKCHFFFLKPLCALTKNHLFEARNYLDHDELKRDVLRIRVFYWLRGYRHTQVDTVVAPQGRGVAVTFKIDEGPPTTIARARLTQSREILSPKAIRRYNMPQVGDRIDLTRLDSLKTRVRRELWDRGYGNAEIRDTVRPIDSLHVALSVNVDVGPLTRVDTVLVEGNERVTQRTVRRLVGLHGGDLYRRTDLLEAQRRLYRSDLFRQMLISAPDSADSAKTIVVAVREAPPRAVQAAVGFNTIEFGQLQGNLTLYNFIGTARRVDLHSSIANLGAAQLYGKKFFGAAAPLGASGTVERAFLSLTWQLSASVSQPWFFSTRNAIGVSVFSNRRSVPGIVIDRGTGASATLTRTLKPEMPLSFTYRYERARIEAGDLYFCVSFGYCRMPIIRALQQSNSFSPFVITLRADRTDDPLMPTTGYTARFDAEHASGMTASDWRFNRLEAEVTPYLKIAKRTLVVRGHYGVVRGLKSTMPATGLADGGKGILLHPRTRFYGGGARSVRGFAEGQLGPRVLTIDPGKLIRPDTARGAACTEASIADRTCDPNVAHSNDFVPRPVGGNSMLEGTLEYRFALGRNIGGAVFIDGGRVGGSTLDLEMAAKSAVTPGVGFRYLSPIGPVRIDLGVRPRRVEDLPVITQIRDADGELRLIELSTPKRYDPSEGSHNFLGKITSRLQLHLYIGEAY